MMKWFPLVFLSQRRWTHYSETFSKINKENLKVIDQKVHVPYAYRLTKGIRSKSWLSMIMKMTE